MPSKRPLFSLRPPTAEHLARWKRQAAAAGMSLNEWIVRELDREKVMSPSAADRKVIAPPSGQVMSPPEAKTDPKVKSPRHAEKVMSPPVTEVLSPPPAAPDSGDVTPEPPEPVTTDLL